MAYRYRLYPSDGQAAGCERHCADARFVWNLALEQTNCWRPGRGPTPGHAQRMRQLAEARRCSWLGDGSSSVQQQALRDFGQALRNWWAGTHRRPTWRKRGVHDGFCIRDVSVRHISRKWAEVHVPKVGWTRFRLTRPLGPHGQARVTKDRAGRWHVSFAAPQPGIPRQPGGGAVGVDLGVAHTITTSAGHQENIPGLHPPQERRLIRLQRQLARQQKGSHRRARTKHAIAVLHARAADRRRDWAEKTSTRLVADYDLVAFEHLRVNNMLRSARGTIENPGRNVRAKAGLNRRIAASAWATLGPHPPQGRRVGRMRSGPGRPERHEPGMLRLPAHHDGEPAQPSRVSLRRLWPRRTRRRQRGEKHPRPRASGACAWRDARTQGTR